MRHAGRMDRRGRIAVTAAVTAALVLPVAIDRDGLPLSTYPMYSRTRGEQVSLVTARAVTAEGQRSELSLGVIGESDDPLVVAGELRAAIGDGRADQRCGEIADRAAGSGDLPADVVAVEVVTERHRVVDRATGDESLVERTVHASCEVPA